MTSSTPVPWYRQFWPWFLIAFPALSVVGGINMLVIASKGEFDLIDENYYQSGLNINQRIARDQFATDAQISANLLIEPNSENVVLYLYADGSKPAEIQLNLAATANSSLDRVVQLRLDGGVYRGTVSLAAQARYYIELLDDAQQWRLTSRAILPSSTPVQIKPLEQN